jgi:hypothetical protein
MKKYQFLIIVFVFWWSIFCPSLGYPSESCSIPSVSESTSPQKEMQEPSLHFRFKYFTFLNQFLPD